jgi:adenylate kinase family enzyme
MKKIAIIGSGGTGKSTLARELGEILKLPVYHLDTLYWKPGWVKTPIEEWEKVMVNLVSKDKWIIDGSFEKTLDIRLKQADTVIFLDYPTYISLFRFIKRYLKYRGKSRPDIAPDCEERLDFQFISWLINYRKNKRPDVLKKLNAINKNKQVHIITSPRKLQKFLDIFSSAI